MPSDAERDALRERDPERIYLEPPPYSPEGRVWCAVDVWPLEGDGPSGVEYVRADLVRRELDAPADRDALWRDYEEARDAAVNRAFRDGRAGVPDDDESDAMTEARARLDAAVRALATAPPAEPREREDARLRAIEEQLDDLAEAVWRAAAEPKCVRCGHPKSWHRHNDAKDDSLFRCIGYDCAAPGSPKPPCGCPDFLAAAPREREGE